MINKKLLLGGIALLGSVGVSSIMDSPSVVKAAYNAEVEKSYFKEGLKQAIDKQYLSLKQLGVANEDITRAEFAAVMYKAVTNKENTTTINFNDVSSKHPYYQEILGVAKLGLIAGYQDGTFKPDAKISREEMAILILRFLEKEEYSFNETTIKKDFADISKAKYPYVLKKLRNAGIVAGYENNTYKPANKISKEEAIILILRADNLVEVENAKLSGKGLVTGDINVRYAPSFSSSSFGLIKTGAKIEYKKLNDTWFMVKKNGKIGYVYSRYIENEKDGVGGLAYAKKLINIYDMNGNVYTYVATGTELTVVRVETDSNKTFIKIGSFEGFVNSDETDYISNPSVNERSYYNVNSKNEVVSNVYNPSSKSYSSFVLGKNNSKLNLGDGVKYYSEKNIKINNKEVYPYYNYLPLRTKSNITAKQIDTYIESVSKNSPLIGLGEVFVDAANKYELNAMYLVANALHESAYGLSPIAIDKKNLFGFKAYDASAYDSAAGFETLEEGIYYCAEFISSNYLNPNSWRYFGAVVGDKSVGMNVKYASDLHWGAKIAGHMYKMDKFIGFKDMDSYEYGKIEKGTVLKDSNGTEINVLNKDRIVAIEAEVIINGVQYYKVIADEFELKYFYVLKSKFQKFDTF